MCASTFFFIIIAVGLVIALISIIIHFYQKSRGKVSVVPDKYNFALGEKVTGKVIVELKKPIMGSKLTVSLVAQKKVVQPIISVHKMSANANDMRPGITHTQQSTRTIYSFEMPLDSAKEYSQAEYPFEINIPQESLLGVQGGIGALAEGTLGKVIEVATEINAITGNRLVSSGLEWNLHTQLYVPGEIDIRGKTQINVG